MDFLRHSNRGGRRDEPCIGLPQMKGIPQIPERAPARHWRPARSFWGLGFRDGNLETESGSKFDRLERGTVR